MNPPIHKDSETGNLRSPQRYWAFISYSRSDDSWALWLHRALETYRLPKRLVSRTSAVGALPRRLLPVFRDADELPGCSDLGAKLNEALQASRSLIVICSPRAAQSRWVDQEIRTYQALGVADRIFAVIVDGDPNATDPARACFPAALRRGSSEPLACDPRKGRDGKRNCQLRLIAGILGIDFDDLKRRDQQRRVRRAIFLSIASLVLLAVLGVLADYGLRQSSVAESRRRAIDSQQITPQDPVRGLQLAIHAAEAAPTVEAAKALSSALTHQLTRTILFHPSRVASAVFSPDATRVLTCTDDGTARIWDTATGRLEFTLADEAANPKDEPRYPAYSPDGTRILTVGRPAGPRLWTAASGALATTLSGHTDAVRSGHFSPDGTKVVTASADRTVRVWDASTGLSLRILQGHDTDVVVAFFFPDNTRIVSVDNQGTARVWNVSTGAELVRFGKQIPELHDAELSPDGSRLLLSNFQYSADLWDPGTGRHIKQLTTRSHGAAFSRNSSRLITGSGDGRVTVWEAKDGSQVKELFHDGPVGSVTFSPDGSQVVTANERLHVWNTPELGGGADAEIFPLRGHASPPRIEGFSRDGRFLLTHGREDRTVRIWDLAAGPHQATFGEADPRIGGVAHSPDGSKVLTSGDRLQVWNAATLRLLATTRVPPSFSYGVQFSSEGERVLAYGPGNTVCVFDTADGSLLVSIDAGGTIESALSPDGSRVAVAHPNHSVGVYEVPAGNRIAEFTGATNAPARLVFSPDGRQLLVAIERETRVWDVGTGAFIRTLPGYGALFSPNASLVVTYEGNTARCYDASDGRLVREWMIPGEAIETVAFSQDATRLAAGSNSGAISVWNIESGNAERSFAPQDGRVRNLQFTLDGSNLIAQTDGGIHAYDMRDGNEWQVLRNNYGLINASIAPNGSAVVATDTLGRALVYSLRFQDMLETARKRLPAIGSAP